VGSFGFGAGKRGVGAETHVVKKALAAFGDGFGLRDPDIVITDMKFAVKTRGIGTGLVRIGVGVGSRTRRGSNAIQ
jgi:hypothetical protein